jgi:hypothetical protein
MRKSEYGRAAQGLQRCANWQSPVECEPLVAHLHNALSQICAERASLDESQTHFVTAKSLYTAMKMRFWMSGN